MKFACRDIRYITDPLTRHEKTFLKSFLSGVYAGVIFPYVGNVIIPTNQVIPPTREGFGLFLGVIFWGFQKVGHRFVMVGFDQQSPNCLSTSWSY